MAAKSTTKISTHENYPPYGTMLCIYDIFYLIDEVSTNEVEPPIPLINLQNMDTSNYMY